jgi:hypothetical protein
MYDLKLIPIHQEKGQPIPQQTGFLAASPPRRAARSREEDLLILSFTTNRGESLSPELHEAWLSKLAETFFKTGGSVTSALRSLIETLNLTMMEKNLKSATAGPAVTGTISLTAIHHRAAYVAQSGLTHAYVLNQGGVVHFHDASRMDRGLGLSRTPTIRYYQAELGAGGYLFMTNTPAETWTEDQLCKDGFPNLEQLRRRLLNQASPNLRLDLVQILPGEGEITTVHTPIPAAEQSDRVEPVTAEEKPDIVQQTPSLQPEAVVEFEDTSEQDEASAETDFEDTQKVPPAVETVDLGAPEEDELPTLIEPDQAVTEEESKGTAELDGEKPDDDLSTEERPEQTVTDVGDETPEKAEQPKKVKSRRARKAFNEQVDAVREEGLRGLARFFRWWGKVRADIGRFFKNLFSRGRSTDEAGLPELSLRTSLIIAIAVPLAVVAIAMSVYLVRGRTLQYEHYLDQAQLMSASAQAAGDPSQARDGYAQAILFLDQAESFRRTDEITQLRAEAQRALDVLDGAVRLSYHPAIIGALYDGIYITRIISYGMDLYMLDEVGGRVIHATRGSQGYQVDADFLCSAGNFSGGAVDTLVDIAPQPINNPYQAHILAADAFGNVIFCGPGQDPVVQTLPRGEGAVGAVTRIASEGSLLYILDPSAEAVRVYRSTNGQFLDAPTEIFASVSADQKPALGAMVDLAVNGSELYLLREDGRLAHCVVTGLSGNPVNCENPAAFVDGRPGKEDQPVTMPDSRFASVLYTAPPDPAVNILDADNADIFRFSLRFRLYQRMRSDFGNYEVVLPSATAFTIGVDRIAFIAFGHQVFWAYVE